MAYAWFIDHVEDDIGADEIGTIGPRHADPKLVERLVHEGAGDTFRMTDDDGEVYYVGRIILDDNTSGFEPLDDFGMPNAGCTSIEYREKTGAWVML